MNFNRAWFLSNSISLPHMCWLGKLYPMPSLLYSLYRVMTPIFFLRFTGMLYSISYIRYFKLKWDHLIKVLVLIKKSLRSGLMTFGLLPNLKRASTSLTVQFLFMYVWHIFRMLFSLTAVISATSLTVLIGSTFIPYTPYRSRITLLVSADERNQNFLSLLFLIWFSLGWLFRYGISLFIILIASDSYYL